MGKEKERKGRKEGEERREKNMVGRIKNGGKKRRVKEKREKREKE